MADVLRESHGYERTEVAEDADLLLVNTCSIREKAQEKGVLRSLGRWRRDQGNEGRCHDRRWWLRCESGRRRHQRSVRRMWMSCSGHKHCIAFPN